MYVHVATGFEVALDEDAVAHFGVVANDVTSLGVASGSPADAAIGLGQTGTILVYLLHLLQGHSDVVVQDKHRTRLDFAHLHVAHQVLAFLFQLVVFGLFAFAFSISDFAGAAEHSFTDKKTVVAGQDAARTALVAGTQLEEIDVFNLFVFNLFQEFDDIINFVDGVVVLHLR